MNKIFLFFICLLTLPTISAYTNEELASAPISLAALEGEPSSIVHGCVSAITGDYVESEADIIIPGVDPLVIQRTYSSTPVTDRSMGHGWGLNHHGYIDIDIRRNSDHISKAWDETHALITDETGSSMMLFCKHKVSSKHVLKANSKALHFGVTNSARGVISAKTNWENIRVNYDDENYHAYTGSGAHYIFDRKTKDSARKDVHRLLGIEKPNGTQVAYEYDKHYLNKIIQKDRQGNITSWADIERKAFRNRDIIKITAYDGREVEYVFSEDAKLRKTKLVVLGNCLPFKEYIYSDDTKKAKIEQINLPDRFRKIEYYSKGKHWVASQDVKISYNKDDRLNRVKKIREPVGTDGEEVTTSQFIYEIDSEYDRQENRVTYPGLTKVYDALNHLTIYHYNGDHRLTEVNKYKGSHDYALYSREKLR